MTSIPAIYPEDCLHLFAKSYDLLHYIQLGMLQDLDLTPANFLKHVLGRIPEKLSAPKYILRLAEDMYEALPINFSGNSIPFFVFDTGFGRLFYAKFQAGLCFSLGRLCKEHAKPAFSLISARPRVGKARYTLSAHIPGEESVVTIRDITF